MAERIEREVETDQAAQDHGPEELPDAGAALGAVRLRPGLARQLSAHFVLLPPDDASPHLSAVPLC